VIETTALGAAYAAGLTVGFWKDIDEISTQWKEKSRWVPTMSEELRSTKCLYWSKAVDRTLDWAENE
jgi:glycerol kinase